MEIFVGLKYNFLKNENWNETWEKNFYQPIIIGNEVLVKSSFHKTDLNAKYTIVIDPKMSFGTGHHATTYMMMKQMEGLNFEGKTVFDYGCGTCVLAILAQKLAAKTSDAIDIDSWAYENTIENVEINHCADTITVYCGEIEAAPTKEYDVVLANINRNVILSTMDKMAVRLKKGGHLLTSGFLEADVALVLEAAAKHGLKLVHKMEREQWRCLMLS